MYTKKYQVFVSSTFNDLKDDRNELMLRLLLDGFIPAGMELFGAVDEEQFEHIKRIIDVSDYYVVIVGNRYGATDSKGVSYTEKEYLYAKEKKIPVLALLHSEPGNLAAKHAEKPAAAKKLEKFRTALKTGRLVAHWNDRPSLVQNALSSLHKEMNLFPGVGWVRGDAVTSTETLTENRELRKKLEEIEAKPPAKSILPVIDDLAGLDENFTVNGTYGLEDEGWTRQVTWRRIAKAALAGLLVPQWDEVVRKKLTRQLFPKEVADPFEDLDLDDVKLDEDTFDTIRMQLSALGLVLVGRLANAPAGAAGLAWEASDSGKAFNFVHTVVRTKKPKKPKKG